MNQILNRFLIFSICVLAPALLSAQGKSPGAPAGPLATLENRIAALEAQDLVLDAALEAQDVAHNAALEAQDAAHNAVVAALQAQLTDLDVAVAGLSPGILNVSYVTGVEFQDGIDSGSINGRVLVFEKLEADSVLRITYSDNIRVHSNNPEVLSGTPGTRWIIYLDGNPTPVKTRLLNHAYVAGVGFALAVNSHRQSTLIGYLEAVSVGQHTITVVLLDEGGKNNAFTGFGSSFLLEVMELP